MRAFPALTMKQPPAVGLLPTDHYILKKLYREVLPLIAAARYVNGQWFVRLATFDGYLSDGIAALLALGIGTQVFGVFSGKAPPGNNALETLRTALPGIWFYVGVAALAVYIALGLIVKHENVVSKAVFARDCTATINGLNQQLLAALSAPDPMATVIQIQKSINESVFSATKNGVWPFNGLPPVDKIAPDLDRMTDQIRKSFMPAWTPPPSGEHN